MDKKITFRHMDHSPVMEEHINQQLAKIEDFLEHETDPIFMHIVLEPGRTHAHHHVELRLKSPHYELYSDFEDADMYQVINRVIDIMYRQLTEKKKELLDKRKPRNKYGDTE